MRKGTVRIPKRLRKLKLCTSNSGGRIFLHTLEKNSKVRLYSFLLTSHHVISSFLQSTIYNKFEIITWLLVEQTYPLHIQNACILATMTSPPTSSVLTPPAKKKEVSIFNSVHLINSHNSTFPKWIEHIGSMKWAKVWSTQKYSLSRRLNFLECISCYTFFTWHLLVSKYWFSLYLDWGLNQSDN